MTTTDENFKALQNKITLTRSTLKSLLNDHKVDLGLVLIEMIYAYKSQLIALEKDADSNPIKDHEIKRLKHAIHHLEEAALNI